MGGSRQKVLKGAGMTTAEPPTALAHLPELVNQPPARAQTAAQR